MTRALALLPLLAALTPQVAAQNEEVATTVYRSIKPSVVAVRNVEGGGTGIIFDKSGLILTNAHVVATPLPVTVSVDVGADKKEIVYKRVAIVGYHPAYDLALIKINPAENPDARLTPVKVAPKKPEVGESVFAIGNPGAGKIILSKTLTAGMISADSREIDGQSYYQFSAAINPGNSGGPLVNKKSEVLGIVTFKIDDREGLGFAIPLQGIAPDQFQPAAKRKIDRDQAAKLSKEAERVHMLTRELGGQLGFDDERVKMFAAYAGILYRQALVANPADPAIYYNYGMSLRMSGENEAAVAYLAQSIQMSPWRDPEALPYREMGLALLRLKRPTDAITTWREGTSKFPFASKCWEDLAVAYYDQKQFYDAALSAAYAVETADRFTRADMLQKLREKAVEEMPAADRARYEKSSKPEALQSELRKMEAAAIASFKRKQLHSIAGMTALIKEKAGAEFPEIVTAAFSEPRPTTAPEIVVLDGPAKNLGAVKRKGPNGSTLLVREDKFVGVLPMEKPLKAEATASSFAPDDWLAKAAAVPKKSGRALALKTLTIEGARYTSLSVEVKSPFDASVMSPDGKRVYVVDGHRGQLRSISLPDLVEQYTFQIGSRCTSLSLSKTGVIVAMPELRELWQLNPDTLEIEKRYRIPGLVSGAGSPGSSLVYVVRKVEPNAAFCHLVIIDTAKGEAVGEMNITDALSFNANGFWSSLNTIVLSPDARWLAFPDERAICAVDGLFIKYAGSILNASGIHFGAEGDYVSSGKAVFRASNLARPVYTAPDGTNSPQLLSREKLLFTFNNDKVMVQSPGDENAAQYNVPNSFKRAILHPSGRAMWLHGSTPAWLELPNAATQPARTN